jgi:tetratricopeptide (TPR) repeat protein
VKDSTIFKLAAGAGLLAFVGRLIFVQPEELGGQGGVEGPRISDEVVRLSLEGDYEEALRVASVRQRQRYLNQGGWSSIARVLIEMETAEEGDDHVDARAALEAFADAAPTRWVEETGARGWAAYFLGFQLEQNEDPEAEVAWRLGAEDFERLIRRHPATADAWDWLYRARTYMRLGDDEAARHALADASNWAETALMAGDEGFPESVDSPLNYLRTYGRTWAAVGGVVEAESIWTRLTTALLKEAEPLRIAEDWQRYASTLFRQDEDAGGELAMEMSYTALWEAGTDDPEVARQAAPLWHNAARRFDRREQLVRAEEAWEQALRTQRLAAEYTGDPSAWIDYAEMLAERGHMEDALVAIERGVQYGYTNADRLWNERHFAPLRENERFLAAIDSIAQALDEMYNARRGERLDGREERGRR